jgi:hypothetical protein
METPHLSASFVGSRLMIGVGDKVGTGGRVVPRELKIIAPAVGFGFGAFVGLGLGGLKGDVGKGLNVGAPCVCGAGGAFVAGVLTAEKINGPGWFVVAATVVPGEPNTKEGQQTF